MSYELAGTGQHMSYVSYGNFQEAWSQHSNKLRCIVEDRAVRRICEVGGGANPALGLEYVQRHNLDYTILDISAEELAKAPNGYRKVVANICGQLPQNLGGYDLVFTKMLCEHVPDGEVFHRNVHQLLRPGGLAFHFFPTLYAPPFVANVLLPERLAGLLLDIFAPRDKRQHGKFPARYSWCRGPTARQTQRLTSVGYDILEYRGFFGHSYYRRLPGFRQGADTFARYLVKKPNPNLTTFAYLVMQKRAEGAAGSATKAAA